MSKRIVWSLIVFVLLISTVWLSLKSFSDSDNEVIIYVSTDQDYSEPILKKFEEKTGIKVKAVYDTETTKTVGLVNRLIAEKNNPQADVFWNNEVSRTILLKNKGILEAYISPNSRDKPLIYKDPDGYWTGFSARARVIIYNTKFISKSDAPKSIFDLTDEKWKGRIGIANPLFGTTGSHVSAIFSVLGKEKAEDYFRKLKVNDVKIIESNGMIRDQVVAGELVAGLTDTDDANDAIVEGKSIAMVFPDQGDEDIGALVIPNSVMLIKNSKNPYNGKKLIDYLLSKNIESTLAKSKAAQIPLGKNVIKPASVPDISGIKKMNVTQEEIYNNLNESQKFIQGLLLL